jgi:endonuclease YncB( thermonuclease family)
VINNYTYPCTVDRVIDGDTIVVLADVGFRVFMKQPIRVYGINAPETSTPEGKIAHAAVALRLLPGTPLIVRTHSPNANAGYEKYGRWLADVTLDDGTDFAAWMISNGYAVPYTGGAR